MNWLCGVKCQINGCVTVDRYVCGSVYYGSTMSVASLTGSAYMNMFYSGLAEIPALIFVLLINNRFIVTLSSCNIYI